jgi:hypothetical protein
MAKRYDQMLALIDEIKPTSIIEVGVHRGMRANQLCTQATRYGGVEYLGFDVFDTMDAEFQEAALNGKGMPSMDVAAGRLKRIDWLKFSFVVGDTRETLHSKPRMADFAFIDGDHRVDAIRGDYEALKSCTVVVFDDYYVGDDKPDLALYGANAVVDALPTELVEILPVGDKCKHGGYSHLAVVRLP